MVPLDVRLASKSVVIILITVCVEIIPFFFHAKFTNAIMKREVRRPRGGGFRNKRTVGLTPNERVCSRMQLKNGAQIPTSFYFL